MRLFAAVLVSLSLAFSLAVEADEKKKAEKTERPVESVTLNYKKVEAEGKSAEIKVAPKIEEKAKGDVVIKGSKIKEN